MAEDKRFRKVTWELMAQLLQVDNIEDALSGCIEIIVKTLNSECGTIWLLDSDKKRLHPVFSTGPTDLSNVSIENGIGIEGLVTTTGQSVIISDAMNDPRYSGTTHEDYGLKVRSMICVPLNNLKEVIGCVQVINKTDGSLYDKEELELCEHTAALAAITIDEKGLSINVEEKKDVLITVENLTKSFSNGDSMLQVLKGVNLEIYKNEFLVVLGESGCGKTTMMNIIGGMDYLTSGRIYVEGRDISRLTERELTLYRREYIGFIFQAYNLMPNLTALENVRFIAELVDHPMNPEEAIAKVNLTNRSGNYPGQMSGGQQQRVSIARAIVKRPKLILADEPTAALDYTTSIEVLSVIEDIVKTQGTTILMVTHNPEIAKMANRVIKMRNGKIASIKRNMNPVKATELVW